jgi:CDP-glucose 4,6-dehydratase
MWSGRTVLVTGHTGFKGSWLALWLHSMGAHVHGLALDPPTRPNMFEVAGVGSVLASDTRADVADGDLVGAAFEAVKPDVVFHLAAQPLVRASYRDPLGTLTTNVLGTAQVLEASRHTGSLRAVVVVTSDKVYEESDKPHPEGDALGGHDPYSASKAAAEVVVAAYRSAFFTGAAAHHPARVATARAGNVIGGGDWAVDRLLADCFRSYGAGVPLAVRNPNAVRPWQHVLEPLSGYVRLAERLTGADGHHYARAWNFGPGPAGEATVGQVAGMAASEWGSTARVVSAEGSANPHEAQVLRLDSSLAESKLGWKPRWSLAESVKHTVDWHRAWMAGRDMLEMSRSQIHTFEATAT